MENEIKVRFYLRKMDAGQNGLCPVTGRIKVGGTTVEFSTRLQAKLSLWDTKSGRVNGKSGHGVEINAELDGICVSAHSHYGRIIKRMGSATAGQVKDALLGVAYAQQSLLEFFSAFNDEFAKRIGVDRARGTWEQYRYAYNCISEFIQRKYGL